jgi:hypothetical protein
LLACRSWRRSCANSSTVSREASEAAPDVTRPWGSRLPDSSGADPASPIRPSESWESRCAICACPVHVSCRTRPAMTAQ